MIKQLYEIFAEKWYHGGEIFFYSDPHFGDLDSYKFRFVKSTRLDKGKVYYQTGISVWEDEDSLKQSLQEFDEYQVQKINEKVHKNDTIVFLGDIGDLNYIKKLRAGYKVLILGNHDKGASNYKRVIEHEVATMQMSGPDDKPPITLKREGKIIEDNHLFDEVYEGTLQIGPKLLLSHEPMYDSFYYLNIHGHVHGEPFGYYDHYIIDSEDDETGELAGTEVYGNWFNVIAEGMNFEPISLKNILKQVSLKNIADIHRETIDKAIQSNTKNVEKA